MRALARQVCVCPETENEFHSLKIKEQFISNLNHSLLIQDSKDQPEGSCPSNCIGYDYSSKSTTHIKPIVETNEN